LDKEASNDPFIAPDWQDQSNRRKAGDVCRRISKIRATKADVQLARATNRYGKPPLNFVPRWIDISGARETG
jgi:hypothetical protein